MAKIEVEGEFKLIFGRVMFGTVPVIPWEGDPYDGAPPELVKAARAWLEEQKNTVEVTVRVRFSRNETGGVIANRQSMVLFGDGGATPVGRGLPELAEAAREWARRNPA